MAAYLEVVPQRDAVVEPPAGAVSRPWLKWLMTLRDALNAAPQRECATVELSAQTAAVTTTNFPTAALKAGYYRVTTLLRRTAGTGTATITIGFTLDGTAYSLALSTVSSAATPVSDTRLLEVDADSRITYAVVIAGSLTYDAALCLERVEV